MMLAGMAAGALWGFIPGYLKAKFNVNEIISTLMMNYIAISWMNFWIFGVWTEGGFQMTPEVSADMPGCRVCLNYAQAIPVFRGLDHPSRACCIGIVAAIILWLIVYRSRWGYEIRLIGDNPQAAKYAGINITRNIDFGDDAFGALAGLGGMSEVTGVVHRLQTSPIAAGYGFTGIIVAWLAKLNPLVDHPGLHPVWRVDPGGTRNPAFGCAKDDPGHHSGLSDRQ